MQEGGFIKPLVIWKMNNKTEPLQNRAINPNAILKCGVQYRNLRVAYGSNNWTCFGFRLRNYENGRPYCIVKLTAIYLDEYIYMILKDKSPS